MSGEGILDHFEDRDYLNREIGSKSRHGKCRELRYSSWEKSKREVALAEQERRPISIEEWKAGIRKEELEWEVRDAVRSLWAKGYTTYYSGYEGNDGFQTISFVSLEAPDKEVLKRIWKLTDETGILTYSMGSSLLDKSDRLSQDFNKGEPIYIWGINFIYSGQDPEEIKRHWDRIAAVMPNLGWELLVKENEYVKNFRASHVLETQTQ